MSRRTPASSSPRARFSARVAPPDDEQLEGGDSVGAGLLRVDPLVQVGVGDDAARLVECVRGEDEGAVGGEQSVGHDPVVAVLAVDEESGGERGEFAGDGQFEAHHGLVGHVITG